MALWKDCLTSTKASIVWSRSPDGYIQLFDQPLLSNSYNMWWMCVMRLVQFPRCTSIPKILVGSCSVCRASYDFNWLLKTPYKKIVRRATAAPPKELALLWRSLHEELARFWSEVFVAVPFWQCISGQVLVICLVCLVFGVHVGVMGPILILKLEPVRQKDIQKVPPEKNKARPHLE